MAHAFPRNDVRKLLARLLGWPASNVIFRDEPEPMIAPKAGVVTGLVRLDLTSRTSNGNDDVLRISTPDGRMREVYGGQRSITLTVRAEAHGAGASASDVLEGLRLRLNFSGSLAEFRRVGLALADWGAVIPLPNPVQNRQVSTAALELFLNQVVELEDTVLEVPIRKVSSGHPVDPNAAPVVDLSGDFTS